MRMSDSDFTESVLEAFGFDGTAVPVYEVFDKLADLIDLEGVDCDQRFRLED